MFIKDTENYAQYMEDSCAKPYSSKEYRMELLEKTNLGSEFKDELMYALHINRLSDCIFWAENEDLNRQIPNFNPVGFDIDSLDDLEEYFYYMSDYQKSDGFSDEEEKQFAVKIIAAFAAAVLHYQYNYEYSYLPTLDGTQSIGIRFSSGHEFSFYAYFTRLYNMLETLKKNNEKPGKYNGFTKAFLKAVVRVEDHWDLQKTEHFQTWYSALSDADKRNTDRFFHKEAKVFGVSLSKQETNDKVKIIGRWFFLYARKPLYIRISCDIVGIVLLLFWGLKADFQ